MKKRGKRFNRMPAAIPACIAIGIKRVSRSSRADSIARPMRNLMDMLARGEVYDIDGRTVMRLPEIDERFAKQAEWCEVSPAILGWVDCWARIAPDISTKYLSILAERLAQEKPITPRLVEKARAEFDETVKRIEVTPNGVISSAIRTTQIAWEFEKEAKVNI